MPSRIIWANSGTTTTASGDWWFNPTATTTTSSVTTITVPMYVTTSSSTSFTDEIIWCNDTTAPIIRWDDFTTDFAANASPTFVAAAPAIIYRRSRVDRRRRIVERHEQTRAVDRAKGLLIEYLTPEQRDTLRQRGWFIVTGRSGTRYRINAANNNYSGNVHVLDGDRIAARLCAHLDGSLPFWDHILAQKLMLENAEDDFLKIANRSAA